VMKEKEIREEFPWSKVFEQLPQEKQDEFIRTAEERVVAPRTIIVKQGDPGDSFYIIRSGKVRVFRRGSDGLERDLAVLGAGESFGQISLLTEEARVANVEAMEETHLSVLSREQFESILKDFPDISVGLVKQMSGLLMQAGAVIEKEVVRRSRTPRMSWLHFGLVIGLSLLLALVFNRSNPNGIPLFPKIPDAKAIPEISATSAMEEMKKGDTLMVDAGPEGFYQAEHIQGAINVPLSLADLLYEVTFEGEDKTKKVIVYGGTFSKLYDWELADKLVLKGRKDVRVLKGGIRAWEKAGYPVQIWKEKK